MARLRTRLRSMRRALDWLMIEPTERPTIYTVRIRYWHPWLWVRVAAALWRANVLTLTVGHFSCSIGGGPR